MCTAIAWMGESFYFGRTLDLETSFGERAVITPRRFWFDFRCVTSIKAHYAMLGMAAVANGFPLYAECMNEKGLCMAALRFTGKTVYAEKATVGEVGITSFELIPWVLGQCASIDEADALLRKTRIVGIPFSDEIPLTSLHWMVADGTGALTVECTEAGQTVHRNTVGVLTNAPAFPAQLAHWERYRRLHEKPTESQGVSEGGRLGMGAYGLPGDYSSPSRFVRAAWLREHTHVGEGERGDVAMLAMLGAVSVPRGCVETENGHWHVTRYAVCADAKHGRMLVRTPRDVNPTTLAFSEAALDGERLYERSL